MQETLCGNLQPFVYLIVREGACLLYTSVGIVALVWVFLVRQRAPQTTDAEHLAPLQLLDERDAVEEFSVHQAAEVEMCIRDSHRSGHSPLRRKPAPFRVYQERRKESFESHPANRQRRIRGLEN